MDITPLPNADIHSTNIMFGSYVTRFRKSHPPRLCIHLFKSAVWLPFPPPPSYLPSPIRVGPSFTNLSDVTLELNEILPLRVSSFIGSDKNSHSRDEAYETGIDKILLTQIHVNGK